MNEASAKERAGVTAADVGLFLIRAIVGVVFLYHGSQKLFGLFGGHGISGTAGFMGQMGFPLPTASAVAAGGAEFLGGVALLTGVAMRLLAVPLAFTMYVAAFAVHGSAFGLQNSGMEYALTLAVVVTGLALTGAGRLTLAGYLPSRRFSSGAGRLQPAAE